MNVKRVDKHGTGILRVGVLIGSVAILGTLLLVESGAAGTFQRRKPRVMTAQQKMEDLYRSNCARCHGADGRGETPLGQVYKAPNLTDREWWQQNAESTGTRSLVSTVTNGKGGMPAFGKKLSRPEIRLLVKHMRRFKNQTSLAPAQK